MSKHEGRYAMIIGWILGWPTGAVRALVAAKGYEWFVADTFGVRPLSLVQAWGLFLLISFATISIDSDGNDKRRPLVIMLTGLITSLLFSGLAFVGLLILANFR